MESKITNAGALQNRRKPKFIRKDWHKNLRLGQKRKKARKWRLSRGLDNKVRAGYKGYSLRPCLGWGNKKADYGKIDGLFPVRIENISQLKDIGKNKGIIIAKIGERKRKEIIAKAKEMKITILNKYKKEKQNATSK